MSYLAVVVADLVVLSVVCAPSYQVWVVFFLVVSFKGCYPFSCWSGLDEFFSSGY